MSNMRQKILIKRSNGGIFYFRNLVFRFILVFHLYQFKGPELEVSRMFFRTIEFLLKVHVVNRSRLDLFIFSMPLFDIETLRTMIMREEKKDEEEVDKRIRGEMRIMCVAKTLYMMQGEGGREWA